MKIPDEFFSIPEELTLFLLSCAAGAVMGVIFDGFRALRLMIRHSRLFIVLEDAAFLCGYAIFLPSFASVSARGELRLYFVIGSVLGFVIYYFTAGRFVLAVLNRLFGLIRGALHIVLAPVMTLYALIRKKAYGKFVGSNKSLVKFIKKIFWYLKKPLNLLYNKMESTNRKKVDPIGKKRNKRQQKIRTEAREKSE